MIIRDRRKDKVMTLKEGWGKDDLPRQYDSQGDHSCKHDSQEDQVPKLNSEHDISTDRQ
jgi:hypothetical protein